jgi:hypothetical protein
MNLQNGYKVIYEKIADGERTFFADKMDGTKATQLGDAIKIGQYKLVYEKDGQVYGSESGVPSETDKCFDAFNEVFVEAVEAEEPAAVNVEPETNEPEVEPAVPENEEEPSEPEDEE